MVTDKKDEGEEIKSAAPKTKSITKSKYVVDLLVGDRIIGQIMLNPDKNSLEINAPDREGLYNLEIFVHNSITTADGKTFNPAEDPKNWLLNLHNVAPLSLYKTWSALEGREIK